MVNRYFSAIITYNPDMNWLLRNISSIAGQVEYLLIVDNGSNNASNIRNAVNGNEKIELIENNENMGIAYALNQIMEVGVRKGYQWVLTLDQDCECRMDVISEIVRHSELYENDKVGIFAARMVDVNLREEDQVTANTGAEEAFMAITAGSMTNIEAVQAIGGFANELFIDYVDFDICIRLRHSGYKIINVKSAKIEHELGQYCYKKVLGKTLRSSNHSPLRRYYIYRNYINLLRKFRKIEPVWLKLDGTGLIRGFIIMMVVEKQKIKKATYILRGVCHGIISRYGKL